MKCTQMMKFLVSFKHRKRLGRSDRHYKARSITCISADTLETEQAVCDGELNKQKEQEATAAAPQKHGSSHGRSGTAPDSL